MGPISTCTYCGAQTRIDEPARIAKPPMASGTRLADTIAFVTQTSRKVPLLEANAPVPIHQTLTLSTSRDNQETLEVSLVQGSDAITSFSFPLQQRAPRGVPKIALTVRVSATGAMSLTLSEQGAANALDRDGLEARVVA